MNLYELAANKNLTETQKRILGYLMAHYNEAVFMNAGGLARQTGSSESSVVRLAQALGFSGFSELQKKMREKMQKKLNTVSRLEHSADHVGDQSVILRKLMEEDINNIRETVKDISASVFRQSVDEMHEARRIFLTGLRGAYAPALLMTVNLGSVGKEAHLLAPGYGEVWDIVQDLGAEDLVIGISLPRHSSFTLEILEHAAEKGARVGAITDSPLSPLAGPADFLLPVRWELDSFIESFTATVSLINALVTALGLKVPHQSARVLGERESIWEEKNMFVSSEKRQTRGKGRNKGAGRFFSRN